MSFSGEVKAELEKHISKSRHCQLAELAAIISFSGRMILTGADPRLEIATEHAGLAKKCYTLLKRAFDISAELSEQNPGVLYIEEQNAMRRVLMDAKMVERKKHHVVYLKEGAQIVDMLNIMEAHVALMNLENVRILKEMRNSVNRQVNCETANINKTVNAAVKQIEDIKFIQEKGRLQELPDNLYEMAQVRLEHPEAPLKELGAYLNPPVGKSGVNHRLRKISEIAENMRV